MKKFTSAVWAVIAAFTLSLTSCKKDIIVVQDLTPIEQCLTYSPQFSGVTTYNFTLSKSDIQAAFSAAGADFDLGKIKEAKLSTISAEVTSTAATFSGISGFELYAKKFGEPDDTKIQIAYISNIESSATTVDMKVNGSDIKSLLDGSAIELILKLTNKDDAGNPVCIKLKNGKIEYAVKTD